MKYRTLTPDLSEEPTPEPRAAAVSESPAVGASATDDLSQLAAATQHEPGPPSSGFEFVLGPMQVTSLGFVLLVVVVLCAGVAYAIGKSGGKPTPIASAPAPPTHSEPTAKPIEITPVASILLPTTPQIPVDKFSSLFVTPAKGQLYIQMGAVDRGMAIVFAQGLIKLGFRSTIIPGPSPKVFRVILGPFPGNAEFNNAKQYLTDIGIDTFARRFDDPEPPAAAPLPPTAPNGPQPTAAPTLLK